MSVYDKVIKLKLNPDRVDVIVPAGEIYQFVMNKMNSNEILVTEITPDDALHLLTLGGAPFSKQT